MPARAPSATAAPARARRSLTTATCLRLLRRAALDRPRAGHGLPARGLDLHRELDRARLDLAQVELDGVAAGLRVLRGLQRLAVELHGPARDLAPLDLGQRDPHRRPA